MMKKKVSLLITALAVILIIAGLSYNYWPLKKNTATKEITVSIPEPKILYGLPSDSFHLETGFVGRNENLSDLLSERGISLPVIHQLAGGCSKVFDLRKMKTGDKFVAFYSKDSTRILKYLVYENNPKEYCVFNFNKDTASITPGKKDVVVKSQTATGIIKSSLWNAMKDSKLNPELAVELSEIYAWTIDFFNIQKGDRFTVLYDEEFIGEESIGIGKIHSASFIQGGKEYFAIRFTQQDGDSYFDENGNSLRKSFLKSPLKFSAHITSRFSSSRLHPILRIRRPHFGVDYSAPTGTPVNSIGEGTVTQKNYQGGGGGNFLRIRHNSVYETTYMHLSRFASGIHPGSRVSQGQMIGFVGSTGLATGPHLDFRVYMMGRPVDPLKIKAPPAEPVKSENKAKFVLVKDSLLKILNKPAYASVIPGN
jgi:murein DD-endopeptidase MepM/ murein hydrolase activator NlpD